MESSPDVESRLAALRREAPLAPRTAWCKAALGGKGVVFLCGTLGTAFDRWQRRLAALSAADAYLSQRIGLEEIERTMDRLEASARTELEAEGKRLLPRRSPGYGDLPFDLSREILDRLDAAKRLGVLLTDSLLLVPSKSVTAVCEIADAAR